MHRNRKRNINSEEKLKILDILFSERSCYYCDHAYNCTGYGEPCDNWIRITEAGTLMRDMDHADLDYETECDLMRKADKELEERKNAKGI